MTPTPSPSALVEQIATVAAAPWWGVPVIAGLFLLAGAALGYVFNRRNDTRKAKREDEQRVNDKTLVLGTEVVALSQEMTLKARQIPRKEQLGRHDEAHAIRLELSQRVKEMHTRMGALYVIGSSAVSNHAATLVERATATMGARGDEIGECANQQNLALTDFVKVLRHSVGIDAKLQDRDPGFATQDEESAP